MKRLLDKYAEKLVRQGLAEPGSPLIGGLDAEVEWNRAADEIAVLEGVFDHLSINSLVFARPAEPFATIIDFLSTQYPEGIRPRDCETRTFLHDIPLASAFDTESVAKAISRRKAVIIPNRGIISYGTVSPEQGFVFYSSVCFACFVLFFAEYLNACENQGPTPEFTAAFKTVMQHLPGPRTDMPELMLGPFDDEDTLLPAMAQAGRAVVDYSLVDSFFGNISCLSGDTIYISQTGSSLDELEGCIDPCSRKGLSCAGLTASSELSAHEGVYARTGARCILHGHPRFSVIMSMVCDNTDCESSHECHIRCPKERYVAGVPVVPGEVGTGPTGLCNTLPPAMERSPAAIVHGHGLFAASDSDFNDAFRLMLETENRCRREYFKRIEECPRN